MVSPSISGAKIMERRFRRPTTRVTRPKVQHRPMIRARICTKGRRRLRRKRKSRRHLAHQGQPGGQGDIGQGTAHLVGFQGIRSGHPGLDSGKAGLDPGHDLPQQGDVSISGGVAIRLRRHQEEQELVIFGEKIACLAQVAQFFGEKGVKGGDVRPFPFQTQEQLLERGVQQGDIRQRCLRPACRPESR